MDKEQVKYVPAYSIVRLDDGQIGYVGYGTVRRMYLIRYPRPAENGSTAIRVRGTTLVEVIKLPAELAIEELARMEKT
jgi:hypothetical protein